MKRAESTRLAEVMREELGRAIGHMRIPGHPRPYYLSYLVRDEESWSVVGKYGAITVDNHERHRSCLADLRVGSYKNDQVAEAGFNDTSEEDESYGFVQIPFTGSIDGIRHALWRLTEARYREAIDDLLRKKSERLTYLDPHRKLPSFEQRGALHDVKWHRLPEVDREHWRGYVKQASRLLKRYPELKNGSVRFEAHNTVRIYVSSEKVLIVQSMPYWEVQLKIWYLSPKGDAFDHGDSWFVTDPAELPDLTALRHRIRQLYQQAQRLASAPQIRSFAGPVLLDPRPAGLLIHEAIGHRLEGSRLRASSEGHTFGDLMGQMVLPEILTVRDDPRFRTFEGKSVVGHYHYDDEGVPAQDAELLRKGQLRGFLTSRTPIGARHHSNGHGRSQYHARPMSRMAVTIVEADGGLDDAALRAAFLEEIKRQRVPFGIRVIEATSGETTTGNYDFQAFLGEVNFATRVFADGREELVRGVDFVGTPLNAVQAIVAAGSRMEVDNSYCGAESGFVPVSTVSPALLLSRLELQNKAHRPVTQYSYPMPWQR